MTNPITLAARVCTLNCAFVWLLLISLASANFRHIILFHFITKCNKWTIHYSTMTLQRQITIEKILKLGLYFRLWEDWQMLSYSNWNTFLSFNHCIFWFFIYLYSKTSSTLLKLDNIRLIHLHDLLLRICLKTFIMHKNHSGIILYWTIYYHISYSNYCY